ncbi:hypothetical protein SEMRO_3125_G344270.1 [Seminavis robusta]|uniref:Uncharacterized protein n=1 Tax=Seminavis robusta TaxID=568900 RepID=A0A9N8HXJ0_9STRA|nr:hypothetical protein SEMRO_3125_G344270.1 [Seminavis robusta]|eukprot:Sro3125_g344270.1 n/a (476) ;mRNA; f:5165-6592
MAPSSGNCQPTKEVGSNRATAMSSINTHGDTPSKVWHKSAEKPLRSILIAVNRPKNSTTTNPASSSTRKPTTHSMTKPTSSSPKEKEKDEDGFLPVETLSKRRLSPSRRDSHAPATKPVNNNRFASLADEDNKENTAKEKWQATASKQLNADKQTNDRTSTRNSSKSRSPSRKNSSKHGSKSGSASNTNKNRKKNKSNNTSDSLHSTMNLQDTGATTLSSENTTDKVTTSTTIIDNDGVLPTAVTTNNKINRSPTLAELAKFPEPTSDKENYDNKENNTQKPLSNRDQLFVTDNRQCDRNTSTPDSTLEDDVLNQFASLKIAGGKETPLRNTKQEMTPAAAEVATNQEKAGNNETTRAKAVAAITNNDINLQVATRGTQKPAEPTSDDKVCHKILPKAGTTRKAKVAAMASLLKSTPQLTAATPPRTAIIHFEEPTPKTNNATRRSFTYTVAQATKETEETSKQSIPTTRPAAQL